MPRRPDSRRRTAANSCDVIGAPGRAIRQRTDSRRAHSSFACVAREVGRCDVAALRFAGRGDR